MPMISGIYDSGPISPIVKIKENLSIWTSGQWSHYQVEFIEPMPENSQSSVARLYYGIPIHGGVPPLSYYLLPAPLPSAGT